MSLPALPNPRRVITDTDLETGKSRFDTAFDESLPVSAPLGTTNIRLAYVTDQAPQSLNGDVASYANALLAIPSLVKPGGGAHVWYIDTPPGDGSPLHRTISLDIVIQVEGEIELILESGETRLQKPGDMVIQRATRHAWRNPSTDKWARMIGIMLESQPVVLNDGTALPAELPGPAEH
ncbi:cupin domain protein [Xylariomycetidae sp. FL2044]|nr:cupin domain protein [Xylariomycetidae sp. FL2044]